MKYTDEELITIIRMDKSEKREILIERMTQKERDRMFELVYGI